MSTTTNAGRIRQQVEAQAAAITEAVEHFDSYRDDEHDAHDCGDFEGFEDLFDWANQVGALSVETTYTGSLNTPAELDRIAIVLCTGGPHVELRFDGQRSEYVGYDWFESDRHTMRGDDAADTFAEMWWEMAQEYGR